MSRSSKRQSSAASSVLGPGGSVGIGADPAPETPNRSLILVAALSLVPRLFDALVRPIDYNGYWHLFIARNLSREWRNLGHPPLFLVLLKAVDSLAHAPLVYRSISLVAGAATVYLVGRVLARLGTRPPVPVLGALATAFAVERDHAFQRGRVLFAVRGAAHGMLPLLPRPRPGRSGARAKEPRRICGAREPGARVALLLRALPDRVRASRPSLAAAFDPETTAARCGARFPDAGGPTS